MHERTAVKVARFVPGREGTSNLSFLFNEYTEIERKTRHSGEAIMRYVKDFARILALSEEGYGDEELRIIAGLSEKTIREYKQLIEIYSTEEYQERLDQLHSI